MTEPAKKPAADAPKAPVVDDDEDLTPTPTQEELDRLKTGTYHDRQMKAG